MPKVCNTNHTPHAVEATARIRQFAKWSEQEPPALEYDEQGDILLTNGLFAWISETGACCNWLFSGDAQSMALAYAEKRKSENTFHKAYASFDERGRGLFLDMLRNIASGKAGVLDAFKEFEQDLNAPA